MSHVYRVTHEAEDGTHTTWPDIPGALSPTTDDAGTLYFTTRDQKVAFIFSDGFWLAVERVELVKSVNDAAP